MNKVILVTGASGFVGRSLIDELEKYPCVVLRGWREVLGHAGRKARFIGELGTKTFRSDALAGVDVVIHLAARVHVMREKAFDPLQAFRQVNVEGTLQLLEACARHKVKRFVYLSTIKVNGEFSTDASGFSEECKPCPQDAYAQSKYEAELLIKKFCHDHQIEWVIVRPPLIYGREVKANFRVLIDALRKGLPLPLGGLKNRRSLLALENLNDFLMKCAIAPEAANELFLICDDHLLSVSEIVKTLKNAMGSYSWLPFVSSRALNVILQIIGKGAAAQRLCGDLVVDNSKARTLLSWSAVVNTREALSALGQSWSREPK